MSPFDALKLTRREQGVSKHIPITHLNEPTIFEASNSMMGMVMRIGGVPFDTENVERLNQFKLMWHQALLALDERFCVTVTVHRRKENIQLKGEFANVMLLLP